MTHLAARAEVDKLGRALGLDPLGLSHLQDIPAEDLRALRQALDERLHTIDASLFRGVARLLRWVPIWFAGWMARLFGPLLTARVAGEMPARRGARMAQRLPTPLLAEVCQYLDPRCAHDLILMLPVPVIVEVALELVRRRDWMTTGRFVDALSDEAICAVLEQVHDDEVLLRIAYYVESRDRLDHVVRLLPRERLRQTILLAVEPERDVLTEVVSLIVHVSYALKRELGDLAAAQDESVLDRVVAEAQAQGAWADLLPVISVLSEPAQYKVVNLPVLRRDPAVLASILDTAHRDDLWCHVLPLIRYMDEPMKTAVAAIAVGLTRDALAQAADAALMGEHWEWLLDIASRIPPHKQREWADAVRRYREVDEELWQRVARRAQELGFGDAFADEEAMAVQPYFHQTSIL